MFGFQSPHMFAALCTYTVAYTVCLLLSFDSRGAREMDKELTVSGSRELHDGSL